MKIWCVDCPKTSFSTKTTQPWPCDRYFYSKFLLKILHASFICAVGSNPSEYFGTKITKCRKCGRLQIKAEAAQLTHQQKESQLNLYFLITEAAWKTHSLQRGQGYKSTLTAPGKFWVSRFGWKLKQSAVTVGVYTRACDRSSPAHWRSWRLVLLIGGGPLEKGGAVAPQNSQIRKKRLSHFFWIADQAV